MVALLGFLFLCVFFTGNFSGEGLFVLGDAGSGLAGGEGAGETGSIEGAEAGGTGSAESEVVLEQHPFLENVVYERPVAGSSLADPAEGQKLFFAGTLVGHWKMDEGTGTSVADSSGYGNNGSVANGTLGWVQGMDDDCLNSNYNAGWVAIPNASSLSISNDITFMAWVQIHQYETSVNVWPMYKAGAYAIKVGWNNYASPGVYVDGAWRFSESSQGLGDKYYGIPQTNPSGWHHIAGTYSSTTRELKFYVNGDLFYTRTLSGLSSYTIATNTNPVYLLYDNSRNFDVDDVRIYNGVRTQDEIRAAAVCSPPPSGNWTVSADCEMYGSKTAAADVTVQNNSVLTIDGGGTLNMDFANRKLLVKDGSGVLIQNGGKIT